MILTYKELIKRTENHLTETKRIAASVEKEIKSQGETEDFLWWRRELARNIRDLKKSLAFLIL